MVGHRPWIHQPAGSSVPASGSPGGGGERPARVCEAGHIGTALGLLAVLVLVLATSFFVAAEFAVVAIERSRLEALANEGSRRAKVALEVHRRLSFHLSGAQLGITVVSLVLGFVAEPTLARVIAPAVEAFASARTADAVSLAIALALATVLSMVVGELIPKNVVLARPVRAALLLARPLTIFSAALGPFIRVSNGTANAIVRRLGIEPQEELASVRSLEELHIIIRSSFDEGQLQGEQATLLDRSIRFGEKTAADALVPRTSVQAVSSEDTLADMVAKAVETGHSRFPVVGQDLDDVVGLVLVKDVYRVDALQRDETPVTRIMSAPFAVPETRLLEDLFADLRQRELHFAIVVDEYGGTAGILTMEDLLEEIVGEIDDEYDPPTTAARSEADGTWRLAGTLHADEVRHACNFEVPDGEYDTLAGFLLDRLGHIPVAGEGVDQDGWRFEVVEMDGLRVATVLARAPSTSDRTTSAAGTEQR